MLQNALDKNKKQRRVFHLCFVFLVAIKFWGAHLSFLGCQMFLGALAVLGGGNVRALKRFHAFMIFDGSAASA